MSDNDTRITIYSNGTTVLDGFEYAHAQGLRYGSLYPVGWGDCTFFLPGDPTYLGRIAHKMTVVITNGFTLAWAGRVTKKKIAYNDNTAGIEITAIGHFGDILMPRGIRKPWADTRIDDGTWVWVTTVPAAELCDLDRENRLRLTPKAEAWTGGDYTRLAYTAPTGQTIKRFTCNYELQEGAQAWTLGIYNVTAASNMLTVTTSNPTPGTRIAYDSGALATPTQQVFVYLQANANQTPTSDGTYFAELASVTVYTESSAINPTEILTDVVGIATEFSTDVTQIASNTLTVVPFVADPMTLAEIVAKAAGYGDATYNAYGFGVRALDSTNKPILFYEVSPVLTDYDYTVSLDSQTLQSFEAEQDASAIRNWITVGYQDESGRSRWVTPDDDANLTDATSVATYGRRDEWISLQTTSTTTATNYGRRYLAKYKDLQWRVSGSFPVMGFIANKNGSTTPASLIMAGKRVRIANYLNDLNGTGLTLLITGVDYDDTSQTATITVGESNSLEVMLARMEG